MTTFDHTHEIYRKLPNEEELTLNLRLRCHTGTRRTSPRRLESPPEDPEIEIVSAKDEAGNEVGLTTAEIERVTGDDAYEIWKSLEDKHDAQREDAEDFRRDR